MSPVTSVAHRVRCLAFVCLSSLGCGGEVALNGLAPVDAGEAADTTSDMHASHTPGLDAGPPTMEDALETSEEDDAQATVCGPSTCSGCCDALGYCYAGNAVVACGVGGGLCAMCSPPATCSQGSCQANPPPMPHLPCESLTCQGCCDSNGTCQLGQSAASCGTGGNTCTACGTGMVCSGGSCQPDFDGGPCIASSCSGCIPVYQAACCKADQTCGCQVVLAPVPEGGNPCK